MSVPMASQSQQHHPKRHSSTTKARQVQRNSLTSPSIDEQALVSASERSTLLSPNPTFLDSISRVIWYLPQLLPSRTKPADGCGIPIIQEPERTKRSYSMAQGRTAIQAEPPRSIGSSLCRDVGEHIQARSHIGLGERLKEAWKSALPNREKCQGCYKDISITKIVVTPCDHKYCSNCVCKMASLAMKDKKLFPVRCCGQEIPAKRVSSALHVRERKAYLARLDEHAVPPGDRWYCPHPTCGRWIHPRNLTTRSKPLKCPYCRATICFNCRDLAHEERECAMDNTLGDFIAVARRHHWQRCYRCHAMVEKIGGCTHMKCLCLAEFCYVCGDPYPCDCRGTEVAVGDDARRLQDDGDIDLTTVVAAMEQAEREEQEAEIMRRNRNMYHRWTANYDARRIS